MENICFIEIFSKIYVISKTHINENWKKTFQEKLDAIWNTIKNEPLEQIGNYWELLGDIINDNLSEKWYENDCEQSILLYYMDYNYDFVNQKPRLVNNKHITEKYESFINYKSEEYEYLYEEETEEERREERREIEIERARCRSNS